MDDEPKMNNRQNEMRVSGIFPPLSSVGQTNVSPRHESPSENVTCKIFPELSSSGNEKREKEKERERRLKKKGGKIRFPFSSGMQSNQANLSLFLFYFIHFILWILILKYLGRLGTALAGVTDTAICDDGEIHSLGRRGTGVPLAFAHPRDFVQHSRRYFRFWKLNIRSPKRGN